jgi:hypothetical protein
MSSGFQAWSGASAFRRTTLPARSGDVRCSSPEPAAMRGRLQSRPASGFGLRR